MSYFVKRKILNSLNKLFTTTMNVKLVSTKKKINFSVYNISKRPKSPLYVNIGAGKWAHPLWHNLDNPVQGYDKSFGYKSEYNSLIKHDLILQDKLPFKDNSLEAIYCSHVIEHLNDKVNTILFREIKRVLRPGGFFRVTCPDLKLFKRMYERGDSEQLAKMNSTPNEKFSNEQLFLNMFISSLSDVTPPQGVEKITDNEFKSLYSKHGCENTFNLLSKRVPIEIVSKYPRNHDSWHTEEKLIKNLKQAGLTQVYPSRYLQSECKYMRDSDFFDYVHPYESLYVEAVK